MSQRPFLRNTPCTGLYLVKSSLNSRFLIYIIFPYFYFVFGDPEEIFLRFSEMVTDQGPAAGFILRAVEHALGSSKNPQKIIFN